MNLFNAPYDEHGFQSIVIFDDTGRTATAVLRPAKRPGGREILTLIKRVAGRIRVNMPKVRITLRSDGHYACFEIMAWCETEGHTFLFGLPGTATYLSDVTGVSASTFARILQMKATNPKLPEESRVCRYKEFYDGAKS